MSWGQRPKIGPHRARCRRWRGEASHPGPRLGTRSESRRDPDLSNTSEGPLRVGGAHCPLSLTVFTVCWGSVVVFVESASPPVAVCLRDVLNALEFDLTRDDSDLSLLRQRRSRSRGDPVNVSSDDAPLIPATARESVASTMPASSGAILRAHSPVRVTSTQPVTTVSSQISSNRFSVLGHDPANDDVPGGEEPQDVADLSNQEIEVDEGDGFDTSDTESLHGLSDAEGVPDIPVPATEHERRPIRLRWAPESEKVSAVWTKSMSHICSQ